MVDGHIHLENGPLSVGYCMKFVNEAVRKGLKTIQILDHTHRFIEFSPMYESLKQKDVRQQEWFEKKHLEPIANYYRLIEQMKKIELPMEVKFGLEVCYSPENKEFIKSLLNQYPYDFVVGSIHSIDGLLYDMKDFSKDILWDRLDVDQIYKRYYEIMEDMIKSDLFTQIGHPDQLKLFHYKPTYDLIPTYERIAYLAKEHHVAMEHNTGIHYRYQHEDIGTNPIFLNILKGYGVQIITASDAHLPEHVGMLIDRISEI